jgi:multicomponent Na+:H+ antiporter subunit B
MIGMTLIVKTIAQWIKSFIFLYGVYITLYGHLTPGGGFAGGVIMVCSFILLTLAFGKKKVLSKLSKALASELDSIGSLIFLAIATLGMSIGGVFFGNFIQKNIPGREFALLSAGMIPLCNIAIAIKVGSSLFMVFIILAVLRVVEKEGRLEMIQTEMREDE